MEYKLILQSGYVFSCNVEKYSGPKFGLANTAISFSGYQETLSDPSWMSDFIVFTTPHIGTVGTLDADFESDKSYPGAIITRNPIYNYYSGSGSSDLLSLIGSNTLVVHSIDTRGLARIIRMNGIQRVCVVSNNDIPKDIDNLFSSVKVQDTIADKNQKRMNIDYDKIDVPIIDFGGKSNVIRILEAMGLCAQYIPVGDFNYNDFKNAKGYIISSGPGNPDEIDISFIEDIIHSGKPIMGICQGHLLLGRYAGCRMINTRNGHHSVNHPVLDIKNNKIVITSQNHNFIVDSDDIDNSNIVRQTHSSLIDNTNQGLEFINKPIFSFQYHPEGSPGPVIYQDFKRFTDYIKLMQ